MLCHTPSSQCQTVCASTQFVVVVVDVKPSNLARERQWLQQSSHATRGTAFLPRLPTSRQRLPCVVLIMLCAQLPQPCSTTSRYCYSLTAAAHPRRRRYSLSNVICTTTKNLEKKTHTVNKNRNFSVTHKICRPSEKIRLMTDVSVTMRCIANIRFLKITIEINNFVSFLYCSTRKLLYTGGLVVQRLGRWIRN